MNEYVVVLFLILAVVVTQCEGTSGRTLLDVATQARSCEQKP